MRTFRLRTKYVDEKCYLELNRYYMNDNLSITAKNKLGENVMMVTVNTGEKIPDDRIIVKNYSENEGVLECFIKMGFIDPTPVGTWDSGFVIVHAYKLKDKIFKYMKEGRL